MDIIYKDSLEIQRIDSENVVFEIRGSKSYESGEYTNSKNVNETFEVSREKAEEIANQILES